MFCANEPTLALSGKPTFRVLSKWMPIMKDLCVEKNFSEIEHKTMKIMKNDLITQTEKWRTQDIKELDVW